MANFHRSAISRQIKINSINLRKCHHEIQCLSSFFASQLSILEWSVIKSKILKLVYTKRKSLRETHNKKLLNIWLLQRPSVPKCIKNLSDYKLSVEEENCLRFGLKHHILPKKVNDINIKSTIELNYHFLSKNLNCDTPTLNNFKSSISHYVNGFLKASNSIFTSRLNREFHKTLSN